MLLKDLISQLQTIYDAHDEDYFKVMGEPEIMIDTFTEKDKDSHEFHYVGFGKDIDVEYSDDGVYLILNRFAK